MRAGMDEAWVTCADPDRSAGGGAQPGSVRGRRCSGPCASPWPSSWDEAVAGW